MSPTKIPGWCLPSPSSTQTLSPSLKPCSIAQPSRSLACRRNSGPAPRWLRRRGRAGTARPRGRRRSGGSRRPRWRLFRRGCGLRSRWGWRARCWSGRSRRPGTVVPALSRPATLAQPLMLMREGDGDGAAALGRGDPGVAGPGERRVAGAGRVVDHRPVGVGGALRGGHDAELVGVDLVAGQRLLLQLAAADRLLLDRAAVDVCAA